ncbi:MAG TPA: ATP-binding cassette domain-containing protein [Gammaproteobacteria bacterium]|nr:ATP-binding cassette domain-containing protein [Gammaproteobacteria bacterium]
MSDNLVTLRNVSFNRKDRIIFNNVELDIARGKITAVLGPSGTGKTTLLRLIGAQLKPDSGTVLFDNQNIHQLSRYDLYQLRRRIGMLFQSGALFTNLSAFENVAFPLREHTKLSENLIRDLVLLKLQAVGLRGARDLMASELSGGMSRRVALARGIALDPQLIMYDEPFTGQDPIAIGVLMKLIRTLNDALGMTSIVVSHDVQEVFAIADYVYVISNGKIIGQGSPTELQSSQAPAVVQFIKGLPDGVVPFHYPAADFKKDLLGETQR